MDRIRLTEHRSPGPPARNIPQEVMAQNAVFRKAPIERCLEGVYVVNAFSDERSFAEDVLIQVGNRARIGVDARVAAVHARVARPVGPRQAWRYARLKDTVALVDDLPSAVERARRFNGCAIAPTHCHAASRGS